MSWERPKTIKLYLHPPEARRLVTVWPDFKIVSAHTDPKKDSGFFDSYGIRFLFGSKAEAPCWKDAEFIVRSDGIPVHMLKIKMDEIEYLVEVFTNWNEIPDTFVRLTVTNCSGRKKESMIGVMARNGEDRLLYGITGDFYASYHGLLEHWDMVENDFYPQGNSITNKKQTIFFNPDRASIEWVSVNSQNLFAKNYLQLRQNLEPFETVSYYFVMTENSENIEASSSEHSFQRRQSVSQWEAELKKVQNIPDIKNHDWLRPILWSLICQCLQMFVKDEHNIARPRQGGRWAGVWPVEAMEFLIAFDLLGLFHWSEKGYRFFVKHQEKDGEHKGRFNSYLSAQWENITGGVLYGLSQHLLLHKDRNCFDEFRQAMVDGFNWIRERRKKSPNGLFPAGRPHDWGLTVQSWCFTDAINVMGVSEMAKAFSLFGDPDAEKIKKEAEEYKNCMEKMLNEIIEQQKERDEIFIPNYLGIPEKYPPVGPYFADGPTMLIRAGLIEPESEIFEKVERYFRNRGWMKNGLTGLMTDGLLGSYASDPWAGHTWYVSFSDLCWFEGWLKRGEKEKAFETMWAQVRYGMSEHYYMLERFADNDPSFCPWQPNASANGRLIQMLFKFFGTKTFTREM